MARYKKGRKGYKRRTNKRRFSRKRKGGRRRKISNKIYTYRMRASSTLQQATTSTTKWIAPQLNDCGDYQRYTNLYDEYIITKLVVKANFRYDGNDANTLVQSGTSTLNQQDGLQSILDFTNNPAVVATTDLNDYATYKRSLPGRSHTRVFVPRVLQPVWKGNASTWAYTPTKPRWFACSNPDIPHLGMTLKAPASPYGTNASIFVEVIYYVKFRHVDSANSTKTFDPATAPVLADDYTDIDFVADRPGFNEDTK